MVTALKAGEADKVAVLRLLMTAMKNEQIKVGAELSDEQAMKVLAHQAKQRKDSITAYEAAGRQDLVDQEAAELPFIETYLPEQMSDAELEKLVQEAIDQVGAASPADMGKVMGATMGKVQGRADGGRVSSMVKKLLAS
jgi:uncharacterized protein YqeY